MNFDYDSWRWLESLGAIHSPTMQLHRHEAAAYFIAARVLTRIAVLPAGEQPEAVLHRLARSLRHLPPEAVQTLRLEVGQPCEGEDPDRSSVRDLLDGHLILRDVLGNGPPQ